MAIVHLPGALALFYLFFTLLLLVHLPHSNAAPAVLHMSNGTEPEEHNFAQVIKPHDGSKWYFDEYNVLMFETTADLPLGSSAQIWLARDTTPNVTPSGGAPKLRLGTEEKEPLSEHIALTVKLGARHLRPSARYLETFELSGLFGVQWKWKWWKKRNDGDTSGEETDTPEEDGSDEDEAPENIKWRLILIEETGWWPWRGQNVLGISDIFSILPKRQPLSAQADQSLPEKTEF